MLVGPRFGAGRAGGEVGLVIRGSVHRGGEGGKNRENAGPRTGPWGWKVCTGAGGGVGAEELAEEPGLFGKPGLQRGDRGQW